MYGETLDFHAPKFCAFDKKMVNNFWQSVDIILEDVSVTEKLWYSDRCNQVKSCTKHGRLDQSQRKLIVALSHLPCYPLYKDAGFASDAIYALAFRAS